MEPDRRKKDGKIGHRSSLDDRKDQKCDSVSQGDGVADHLRIDSDRAWGDF